MPTAFVFRDDAYLATLPATVTGITPEGGILLDRTILYATSGGQPGDSGRLDWEGGSVAISGAVHPDGDKTEIVHLPATEIHGLCTAARLHARSPATADEAERRFRAALTIGPAEHLPPASPLVVHRIGAP